MSKRINELDYVRAIALGMILLCHYLECSGLSLGLGRYLGGAGNTVFFVVSALLYSFRYCSDSQTVDGVVGGGIVLILNDLQKEEL